MLKTTLSAASLAVALVGAAHAQDWTGTYVGAAALVSGGTVDADGTVNGLAFVEKEDLEGTMGGVRAGYLTDNGTLIYGGEIGYYVGDVGYSGVANPINSPTSFEYEFSIDSKAELRAIIGREVDEDAMIFGTLGFVRATTTTEFTLSNNSGGVTDGSDDNTRTGYALGLGYAQFWKENQLFTAEIIYTDLGSETYNGGQATGNNILVDHDVTKTELRIGFMYQF